MTRNFRGKRTLEPHLRPFFKILFVYLSYRYIALKFEGISMRAILLSGGHYYSLEKYFEIPVGYNWKINLKCGKHLQCFMIIRKVTTFHVGWGKG